MDEEKKKTKQSTCFIMELVDTVLTDIGEFLLLFHEVHQFMHSTRDWYLQRFHGTILQEYPHDLL